MESELKINDSSRRKQEFRQISAIVSLFLDVDSEAASACTIKSSPDHLFPNDHEWESSSFIVDLINDAFCRCNSIKGLHNVNQTLVVV